MTQTSPSTRPNVISLADEERVNDVVLGAVQWDVVNNLPRLQPSRRDRYRVTIFGSAPATPGSFGLRGDQARGRDAGRTWSVAQTAVANSIEVNRRRKAGWQVKVPVRNPDVGAADVRPGLSHVRRAVHTVQFPSPPCGIALRSARNRQWPRPLIRKPSLLDPPGAARLMHDQPLRKTPHAVEA